MFVVTLKPILPQPAHMCGDRHKICGRGSFRPGDALPSGGILGMEPRHQDAAQMNGYYKGMPGTPSLPVSRRCRGDGGQARAPHYTRRAPSKPRQRTGPASPAASPRACPNTALARTPRRTRRARPARRPRVTLCRARPAFERGATAPDLDAARVGRGGRAGATTESAWRTGRSPRRCR